MWPLWRYRGHYGEQLQASRIGLQAARGNTRAQARMLAQATVALLHLNQPGQEHAAWGRFTVDREASARLMKLLPDARIIASGEPALPPARGPAHCRGRHPVLRIGSGLPTVENTYQVAQATNPDCRVAYVDYDPVIVNHAQAILTKDKNAIAIGGNLRGPAAVLRELEQRAPSTTTSPARSCSRRSCTSSRRPACTTPRTT
jgi:S-adenosyl methyltransferase